MKLSKSKKRILAFATAVMMLFGNATFAFAKELPNVTVNDTETTNEVVPASVGEGAAAYIAPRGTLVLHLP